MKQRNLFLWLLLIFAGISLYNIYYTYKRIDMENEYEAQPEAKKATWMKSNFDDYKGAVKRSLGLGLDLQGGIYITMEIGIDELIRAMAGTNVNADFEKALANAKKLQATKDAGFVDIFVQELRTIRPNVKLAAYFGGQNISYNSSDEEVIEKIKEEANTAVDNALTVIRKRVDQFGVTSANIQKVTGTNRIIVELPGERDIARVRKLLKNTAQLEFWPVKTIEQVQPILQAMDANYKPEAEVAEAAIDSTKKANDTTKVAQAAGSEEKKDDKKDTAKANPAKDPKAKTLANLLKMPESAGFPYLGTATEQDTAFIGAILRARSSRSFLTNQNIRFAWSAKPDEKSGLFELYALDIFTQSGKSPVRGEHIVDTRSDRDENNQYMVSMSMNGEGTKQWATMTEANLKKSIAVVLDGVVYSAPTVQSRIPNGNSQITGNFTLEEANDLANILKAGKLPAPARIVGEEVVGPTLGQQTVQAGMLSFILGFLAVIAFVVLYYRRAGWIASIALIANLIFLLGISAALNVVMTLPGIAGIVLTMGMAVDANVLIYERVREELAEGRGLKGSIASGFKNAFSAIIDGNLTTFLTGLILFIFGTGPIQGFAVTLMIGIFTTLISGLLVTRILLEYATVKPDSKPMSFGTLAMTRFFEKARLAFIPNRTRSYILTAALTIASIAAIAMFSFKFGVDFRGGRQYVIQFEKEVTDIDKLRGTLTEAYGNETPQLKTISGKEQLMITTSYLIDAEDADDKVQAATMAGLAKFSNQKVEILSSTTVGPTVAKDIKDAAINSILFSLLVMFLYIFIRFGRWEFGMGAMISLAFNVVFVLGIFAVLGQIDALPINVEVDITFIAAILTIVGYTINDTVVVFDRIRERLRDDRHNNDYSGLFNLAINETLSRTIVTSGAVLATSFILLLFAGEVLEGFMLAMIIGIVIGTFSSIFVASPISLDLIRRMMARKGVNIK